MTPKEGFIIKMYLKTNQMKSFINVFHHESVRDSDLLLLCHDEYPIGTTTRINYNHKPFWGDIKNQNKEYYKDDDDNIEKIQPIVYIGKLITRVDKNGNAANIYNILVSSSYFMTEINLKLKTKIGDNSSINKVILFCYYSYYYLSY